MRVSSSANVTASVTVRTIDRPLSTDSLNVTESVAALLSATMRARLSAKWIESVGSAR
jgi:hypothetical protein